MRKNGLQKLREAPGKQITVEIKKFKVEGVWVMHITLRGGVDCGKMSCIVTILDRA
jgi:hypothetical protein